MILNLLLLLGLLITPTVTATPTQIPEIVITDTVPVEEDIIPATTTDKLLALDLIEKAALKYGVSQNIILKTIDCETGGTFNPLIQSTWINKKGQQEESYGLAQIHMPDHPEISRLQAEDPIFSVNYMALQMSRGNYSMWSCFTLLKNRGEL